MRTPLACASAPCASCPYAISTPAGVWDASEYEKLRTYAHGFPAIGVFLCHYHGEENPTVCRGWLSVEQDSVAVRLALCRGQVTAEQVFAAPPVPLYATGEEAAAAGLAGVRRPSAPARRVIARLARKRGGRG